MAVVQAEVRFANLCAICMVFTETYGHWRLALFVCLEVRLGTDLRAGYKVNTVVVGNQTKT